MCPQLTCCGALGAQHDILQQLYANKTFLDKESKFSTGEEDIHWWWLFSFYEPISVSVNKKNRKDSVYVYFCGESFSKTVSCLSYVVITYAYFILWNIFQIWWIDNTTLSTLQNPSLLFFSEWLRLYTSTTFGVVLRHFKN